MNRNNENYNDKSFLLHLHMKAQQKAKEYAELFRERQRLDMRIERTKGYLEKLNDFLKAEGQEPVLIKAMPHVGSAVGKPGNRSKALPLRKMQWEGITINEIIAHILNASPDVSFHPKEVASLIYEIESDSDLKMVMRNMRSSMQRGARDGLWERTDRAKYKAKVTTQQRILANV